MTAPKTNAVLSPNLGLYYNRSPLLVPRRGLVDGLNFRIKDGKLNNYNLGWTKFVTFLLNGRVMKIFNHTDRTNGDTLFFATPTDIYKYDAASSANPVTYMTPRYVTGTVAVAGAAVTGTGTLWLANAKIGDQLMVGVAGYNGVNPTGNDSFTKVLLHMNGTDASTAFRDDNAGGAAHTWTAAGNAQIDTADSVFGGASGLFDGTGDWITTPDAAEYTLGTSDFSINLRFKLNGGNGVLLNIMGQNDIGATAAASSFLLTRLATNVLRFALSNGSAFTNLDSPLSYTTAVNPGWHDLEVTRNGNVLTMYVDGVAVNSTAFAGTVPNSASVLGVGVTGASAANGWNGWLDEVRLSVGTARHTANFTVASEEFYTPWFTLLANPASDTSITLSSSMGTIAAGAPYTIRRLYITGTADQWQFKTFLRDATSGKDIMFATNFVDWVQTWSFGDTQMTSQSGLGFKCMAILPYSNMMIYGNINDGVLKPTSIINSDVSKPLAAGLLGTGLSEEFVVHDGVDHIHSLGHLANSLVIYSAMHTVAAQFVGDPEVFVFRKVSRDLGPVGPFAWADFGDYHEFLGPDGAYRFDGVGVTEIHPHVMRFVRAGADPKRIEFVYTHFIDIESEAIWSVPLTTDPGAGILASAPTVAWVEHYLEDVGPQTPRPFSLRQFPFTATGYWSNATSTIWSSMTETWEDYAVRWSELASAGSIQQLAGDVNGQVWTINTVQQADSVGLASYVQFPRFATGDMHEKNRLQRIYPYITQGVGNITVTTFYSNFATGTMSSDSGLQFDTSFAGNDFVSPMVKGRFGAAQIGAPDGIAYQVEGYNYEVAKMVGGRR